jgi:uncharacterized membrane protein
MVFPDMAQTSLNMGENIEGALCYLLGWLTGIIFYLIEKDNEFVRFHARQSILVFLPLSILSFIFSGGFMFGGAFFWSGWFFLVAIGWLISLLTFILWLVLMFKAYQGERFKLPVVGDIAERGF